MAEEGKAGFDRGSEQPTSPCTLWPALMIFSFVFLLNAMQSLKQGPTMPHRSRCSDCGLQSHRCLSGKGAQYGTVIPACSLEGHLQAWAYSALAAACPEMMTLSQKRYLFFSQYPKLREADGQPVKSHPLLCV